MTKQSLQNTITRSLRGGLLSLGFAMLVQPPALCQYRTSESTSVTYQQQGVAADNGAQAPISNSGAGLVRLARFAYVSGNVSWRADSSMDWAQATTNLPLRQSAQVWVASGGRADIQFDDGSEIRLGNGALLTLKALYSDADGEFTQIDLREGLATLCTRHDHSVYQIDAPVASVVTGVRSRCRVGATNGLELAVRSGSATVEDSQGKTTVSQGQYLYLASASSPFNVRSLPTEDSWDHWNDSRDHYIYDDVPTYHHVPANIALVSGDLDSYGDWHQDTHYGWVWAPRVHHPHWRPYSEGHWTWVDPYGWTWVADDAWGWAPYHYGTWVSESYGWAWVPGPQTQYWSPAVVSFSDYNNNICWAPLDPVEVHYPSVLSVGFQSGSWSAFFSIGQAGCYYPSGSQYCVGRPFDNVYVNRYTQVNNITNITNVYNNPTINRGFVPRNARFAAGATVVAAAAFAGHGAYRPAANAAAYFTHGRVVGAPPAGRSPMLTVPSVRPTRLAMTPTRSFQVKSRPPAALLKRSVYGAAHPGSFHPNTAALTGAHPASRPVNSFTRPGARTAVSRPQNAFTARNTAAAAAAHNARAALGMPSNGGKARGSFAAPSSHSNRSFAAPSSRPNGSFAAAHRAAVATPASRPHTNSASGPAHRSVAVAPTARPHVSSSSAAAHQRSTTAPRAAASRPAAHISRPQPRRSAPQPQRSAPQPRRSAPQPQRSAPQPRRAAPQPQRSAPQPQRSAPPQRPAPQPQRSAPPQRSNGRDNRGR